MRVKWYEFDSEGLIIDFDILDDVDFVDVMGCI